MQIAYIVILICTLIQVTDGYLMHLSFASFRIKEFDAFLSKEEQYNVVKDGKAVNHDGTSDGSKVLLLMTLHAKKRRFSSIYL